MILVDTGIMLQDDTFRRVFAFIEKERDRRQVEWKVKIEKSTIPNLKTMMTSDYRAARACEVLSAYQRAIDNALYSVICIFSLSGYSYMGHMIFEVTPEESPHSTTLANQVPADLPPLLVRTALKLAFIHAAKYRYIIILTTDSSMCVYLLLINHAITQIWPQ